jgi:hypothetical protein
MLKCWSCIKPLSQQLDDIHRWRREIMQTKAEQLKKLLAMQDQEAEAIMYSTDP